MTSEIVMVYPFLFWIGAAFFLLVASTLFGPSRSKTYRQTLADMYIVGKIKQIAKADGLDLNVEFLEFSKVMKNKKVDMEALDKTVERELQEKIAEGKKSIPKTAE